MALSDIEKYINKNKSDVDGWLTALFGEYVRRMMRGEDARVCSDKVTSDARRVGKFVEVVRHYGIGKVFYEKTPYNRYLTEQSWYDIYIDHEAFERIAPQYAKEEAFKISPPDKSTDRVKGYPGLDSISGACMLHIYFNPDLYTIYDRMEKIDCKSNGFKPKVEEKRLIRIYPKSLEGDAERKVFLKTLERYYDKYPDKAMELLYGYAPKVLSNLPSKTWYDGTEGEITIKNMTVSRINTVELRKINTAGLKEWLPKALQLQEYANGLVEDLTTLIPLVEEDNNKLVSKLFNKAESHLLVKAPLLMGSADPIERELAEMMMRGSNKGLV